MRKKSVGVPSGEEAYGSPRTSRPVSEKFVLPVPVEQTEKRLECLQGLR